jgi:hypothetical protein
VAVPERVAGPGAAGPGAAVQEVAGKMVAAGRAAVGPGAAGPGVAGPGAAVQEVAGKMVAAGRAAVGPEGSGTAGGQEVLVRPARLASQGAAVEVSGQGLVVTAWWKGEDADRPWPEVPQQAPVALPREAVEAGSGPPVVAVGVVEVRAWSPVRSEGGPQEALERWWPLVAVPGKVRLSRVGPR